MTRTAATAAAILIFTCLGASSLQAGGPVADRTPPEDALILRYKSFKIAYAIRDDYGLGSAIRKVELFGTTDLGRTWKNYGSDPDRKSPFEISVPSDGVYGFSIVSTDRAGNRELPPEPGTYPETVVIVDTTPPQGAFTSPVENTRIGEQGIVIAWKTEDQYPAKNGVSLHVSGDGGKRWFLLKDKLPESGRLIWKPPVSRAPAYSFRIKVRDRAGNVALIKAPGMVLSDATPPTAKLTGPQTAAANKVDLTYTVTDEPGGSGVDWVELWTTADGGKTWSKYGRYQNPDPASPIVFTTTENAKVGFYLRAADKAGNLTPAPAPGTPPGLTLSFDNKGPSLYLTDIKGGNRFLRGGETIEVQWQAEDPNLADNPVTLSWSADGGQTWTELASRQPAVGSYQWKLPADSERNLNNCLLRVSAYDTLGNKSTVESEQFFSILSRVPHVPITEIEPIKPETEAIKIEPPAAEEKPAAPPPPALAPPAAPAPPAATHPSDIQIEDSPLPEAEPGKSAPVSAAPVSSEAAILEKARADKEVKMRAEVADLLLKEKARKEAELATQAKLEQAARRKQEEARQREEAARIAKAAQEEQARRQQEAARRQAELEKQKQEKAAQDRARRLEAIRRQDAERAKKREAERLAMIPKPAPKAPQVTPATSPAAVDTGAIALVNKGNEAFGDGELARADLYYKQALAADANSVEAYVGLAQLSHKRGDNKMALSYAEKASSLDPDNVAALMETGQISLSEGKSAYKRLKKGMQLKATAEELAKVREDLTVDLRNAKRAFKRINKLTPDNKTAYDWLGETYRLESMIAGDEGERVNSLFDAMEAFKAGYEIGEPNYREAFRLGEIYRQRGELDIARRYFQTGINVCPPTRKPRECQWHLAEIAEEQNALDDARFYWGKVMEAYDPGIPEEAVFYNKAREHINAINLKQKY